MSRSSSEIQKIGLYVIRVLPRARLSRGAGKAEIKPGRLAGRLGTGVRSQPRVHKQDRGEVEDQDLRKNFEHSHGDDICRCSSELCCRESHTGK